MDGAEFLGKDLKVNMVKPKEARQSSFGAGKWSRGP